MAGAREEHGTSLPQLWRRVLVPVDFSTPSEKALVYGLRLAEASGARVDICHIIPPLHALDILYEHGFTQPESVERIRQKARARIKELATLAGATAKLHIHFSEGEAADEVLQWAIKLKPDLIVMGTHGRRGTKRFFMGSVAEAVIRRAPCPVLTLRSA